MAMTTAQQTEMFQFFAIAFGAAPGVTYMDQLDQAINAGMTTKEIVNVYTTKTQFTATYPTSYTSGQFASAIVENVVGTSATAAAKAQAVADITAALTAGWSRGDVIYQVFSNLAAKPVTDADWGGTAQKMANQVAVANYYTYTQLGNTTDLATLRAVISSVTETTDVSTPAAIAAAIGGASGQTFTLTTGVDTVAGTNGNDTINALIDGTTNAVATTLTALDTIIGGAGVDVMNLNVLNGVGVAGTAVGALPVAAVSGVETVNIRSAVGLTADVSTWTGLTAANVTQGAAVTLTGAATTALNVSGATGAVVLKGGASQTVSTSGGNVTVGGAVAADNTAGAISVTHSAQAGTAIDVDGGSTVTVNAAGSTGGAIAVGANKVATGAVAVTSANKAVAGAPGAMASIDVTGGTTIAATQTATSALAAADTTGATVTQGAVTITGGTATTAVTAMQTASKAEVAFVAAVAGVTETASVKFGVLKANDVLAVAGLTFTAKVDMTAAEVASAFSALINADTQSNGPASKGTYTLVAAGWTSAAASGDTVVFTSTTANTNMGDLTPVLTNTSTTSVAPVVTTTDGSAKTTGVAGVLGVANGTVVIDDNATAASITAVTVDGYGNSSTIGATNALTKLATLSLANSGSTGTAGETDADMTVTATGITSLALSVNAVKGAVALGAGGSLKTLNLTATGADSAFALTAANVETLAVSGDKSASLTADLAALKTVTVSGSAGLTLAAAAADTITSINTTATTGKVTATIEGARATYTGGAGVDVVTLATDTAITKAVSLGAGDDTLSFGALTVTGTTAALAGGDGVDTLAMSTAAADSLDNTAVFSTFLSGFERLTINDAYNAGATADNSVADSITVDLANLGFTNYVTTSGTGVGADATRDILVLNKMVSGGTVVLTAQGSVSVGVTDAATGTADVLNAVLSSSGNLTAGTLTAANVETINISAVDTQAAPQTKNVNTLTLTADKATTVNVAGGQDLTLTMTGSTKVTSIDGSTMTGGLTVTSLNLTTATTIKGGSGNDSLTAGAGGTADVLNGGAGNDTLTSNAGLTTLTGGTGDDTFVIATSNNLNAASAITDFSAGDLIKFSGGMSSFKAAVLTIDPAGLPNLTDYANLAVSGAGGGAASWFQLNGNTYVVVDNSAGATFVDGVDAIVKLVGLVDLSTASFNDTSNTISL